MSLQHRKSSFDSLTVLTLEGELSGGTGADAMIETVKGILATNGTKIILDLAGVYYVNSSGIRTLLQVARVIENSGGLMGIVNLPNLITRILLDIGVLDQFRRYPSLEIASQQIG